MTSVLRVAVLAASLLSVSDMATAGAIQQACIKADRSAASQSLCSCIQRVANQSLTPSDRRLASRFFSEPHKAQEIRQSDRPRHEQFWTRYVAFGQRAAKTCG